MYLLDTVVLSELRRRERNTGVTAWLRERRAEELFLSAITIGEVERGIVRQRDRDPGFAEALSAWLERTVDLYADRILPVDVRVAAHWGRLSGRVGHDGADLLIAATALVHGLTVVTRNVRHFLPTGAAVIDPFTPAD